MFCERFLAYKKAQKNSQKEKKEEPIALFHRGVWVIEGCKKGRAP